MSDLNAMVKGVLESLDGAGALADMLAELGREREAVLLRRRWKAWQTERGKALETMRSTKEGIERPMLDAVASLRAAGFTVEASIHAKPADLTPAVDEKFRTYIRERFVGLQTTQVPVWGTEGSRKVGHAVMWTNGGFTQTLCGTLGTGYTIVDGVPKGGEVPARVCRKCRVKMAVASLKPQTKEGETA